MINKTEWNRMMEGKLYNPYKVGDNSFENVHAAQKKFNESEYWNDKSAFEELKKCFKVAPVDMVLTPPVYFDHGDRISFGKHFYANTDLTILDENYVTFGDNVFLAPHVSIYTAGHPIDKDIRNLELEYAKAVTIGDNVWIGGNVVINPGVTIGSDVVIASADRKCSVSAVFKRSHAVPCITAWKTGLSDSSSSSLLFNRMEPGQSLSVSWL